MAIPDDFKELLECFNARGVEYMIVGGYARGHHGSPRTTRDMDLFVRPDPPNAQRVLDALRDFGAGSLNIRPEDLDKPGKIVQLGVPPVRVDLITVISAVSWEEAWSGKVPGTLAGVPTLYIGREEFIRNKLASGRPQDLADVDAVGGELPANWRALFKPRNNQAAKPPRKGPRRRSP